MKYAIISDIHGNMPALQAVIDDANNNLVDEYIFTGDYYGDLPYPNEVVNTIRGIKKSHVIRGNKEGYLLDLLNSEQSEWLHEQLAPIYWNYRELDNDNLKYLISLPEDIKIVTPVGNHTIHLFHASSYLFKSSNMRLLSSSKYAEKMNQKGFSHDEYLSYVSNILSSDDKITGILDGFDTDVHIFGHSHIQWHTVINNKVIINPGSCGLPLDFDNRAAYTILEVDGSTIGIQEKRIPYNIDDTIHYAMNSGLNNNARIWCRIVFDELLSAKDEITFFFRHVEATAVSRNDNERPYSSATWNAAATSWKK